MSFECGVGISRKWDPYEAGEEVAINTLEKLEHDPKFFLLFSTIHYAKGKGGLQKLLDGVWEHLPKETPLIGGTVAGFMSHRGCFTRGVSALSLFYEDMDISIDKADNTRKNPEDVAKKIANSFSKKSRFGSEFVFDVVPGPTKPTLFGFGSHWVNKNKAMEKLGPKFLTLSVKKRQLGQGLEDDVIYYLAKHLPKHVIMGGSSSDNNKLEVNYQFFNDKYTKFSLVALNIDTNLKFKFAHSSGLEPTGIKFRVGKTNQSGRIITNLNGKPAAESFFNAVGIPLETLDDRILRTTFFYPLCSIAKDKCVCPNAIGAILGKHLALNSKVDEGENIELLTTSGRKLINAVNESIGLVNVNNPRMGLIVSCLARLESLGTKTFVVQKILTDYFKKAPFLLLYMGGENTKFPNELGHHYNETFNMMVVE